MQSIEVGACVIIRDGYIAMKRLFNPIASHENLAEYNSKCIDEIDCTKGSDHG